jgi:hypothetical protein
MSYTIPSDEYRKITSMLDNNNITMSDAYNELLQKEKNVLATVNRVVEHEQKKRYDGKVFYNMPVLTVIALFIGTWKTILIELTSLDFKSDYRSIPSIFIRKERKIYLGFMIIIVAVFLYISDLL